MKETSTVQIKPHPSSNTHTHTHTHACTHAHHLQKKAHLMPSLSYIWRKWCIFCNLWYWRESHRQKKQDFEHNVSHQLYDLWAVFEKIFAANPHNQDSRGILKKTTTITHCWHKLAHIYDLKSQLIQCKINNLYKILIMFDLDMCI